MTKSSIPVMEGKLQHLIQNMELYPLIYNAHIKKAEGQEKSKLPLPELKAVGTWSWPQIGFLKDHWQLEAPQRLATPVLQGVFCCFTTKHFMLMEIIM